MRHLAGSGKEMVAGNGIMAREEMVAGKEMLARDESFPIMQRLNGQYVWRVVHVPLIFTVLGLIPEHYYYRLRRSFEMRIILSK